MKAVIQRVSKASVTINNKKVANILHGVLILLGVEELDTQVDFNWLSNKIINLGVQFTNGLANPEIANNSGDVIYLENRRLITRAPDQIEDIKLVIEF